MIKLLLRKGLQGLMMVLIVSAVTFALLGLAGGDALTQLRDNPQISAETVERLRTVYGLDQRLPIRYFRWLSAAVTGDLGDSIYFRVPVSGLVWRRSVSTFLLGTAAFAIALTFAVPLSLIGVRYRSTMIAALIDFVILVTASTPRIVLALVALGVIGGLLIAWRMQPVAEHLELKRYLREHVYRHYRVLRMTNKAHTVIRALFDLFMARPELLPTEHHEAVRDLQAQSGDAGRARAVSDYIAGMTDRYAILEYERLFDPAQRS